MHAPSAHCGPAATVRPSTGRLPLAVSPHRAHRPQHLAQEQYPVASYSSHAGANRGASHRAPLRQSGSAASGGGGRIIASTHRAASIGQARVKTPPSLPAEQRVSTSRLLALLAVASSLTAPCSLDSAKSALCSQRMRPAPQRRRYALDSAELLVSLPIVQAVHHRLSSWSRLPLCPRGSPARHEARR